MRSVQSDDSAAVAELVQLVRERPNDLVDPFPPSTEAEVLADMGARGKGQPGHPQVAIEGGEVVGWGAIDYSPALRRALLVGPVVHPAHRTKGHGRRLLRRLMDDAREAHQKSLRVCVGTHNGAGQALLKADGFTQAERNTCLRLARPSSVPELEMEGIRIERVDSEHGDTYFDFTRKLIPRQRRQVRALLKAEHYAAFLAYKRGKPVGCIEVDMRYGDTAVVENVDAPPSLLSRGLGNTLLAEAVREAFANQHIQALTFLMSGTDRARLEALAQQGFQVSHELVAFELRL
ncbi:MAG: GNAT family N-acetyltransferase [Planctomycetota bacterium]|jgi:N-acetylglutamate synthase-like GNAT family acetyltransferase